MFISRIIFQKSKNPGPQDSNEFWLTDKLDNFMASSSSHLPLSYVTKKKKKKRNMKPESVVVYLITTPCQNVYTCN